MDKKIIVLGVTGGIAAYKSAQLASNLFKKGYDVHVIMTKNATEFITPLTFEVLTNNKVAVDTFDRNFDYNVNHISLAKKADLFVVAPATANVMAKFACGIADDMLTTSYLAFSGPTLMAPAMNTGMLDHVATQRNMHRLRQDGVHFIQSDVGYLACGDVGIGRLADLADIEDEIEYVLTKKSLTGRKVVITAGPTQEAMDPIRFLSNHSSGKMGYALAWAARNMGAKVVLISGPTHLKAPRHVEVVHVRSADEMYQAAMRHLDYDFFIASAAVSDYRPVEVADQKLKKKDLAAHLRLAFRQNEDIVLKVASQKKENQKVTAFAMETENLVVNAKLKLEKKQVDLVVANNLTDRGAGFSGDTNKVTLVMKEAEFELALMDKRQLAIEILNRMEQL
ncbi:MAG: bifunctional phosphopantothenoylcysteine decarboxylase/phosphopantothenate--cysteine ligase CoaBC [Defluviitaleaceae bacterium]|nr:bifunctional phosphopantothenoylcysteine decarboxylase/phosphopantothenate--cysteine ligase CoaBC [Defluviitaleaceae bacterium]